MAFKFDYPLQPGLALNRTVSLESPVTSSSRPGHQRLLEVLGHAKVHGLQLSSPKALRLGCGSSLFQAMI